jgi:pimeloyl-ACP methyl ester carboxylesterase
MVAQVIVQQRPDLVRRVILAGTAPAGDQGPAATGAILQAALEKAAAQGKHPKHFLFFSPTATSQAAADAFLARLDERTEDRDAPVSNETTGAQITALTKWEQGTSSAGLANVDKPVLVVNGDDVTMLPTSSSLHLARMLPHGQLSIYPDSGHGGIFQHHDLFVAQTLGFSATDTEHLRPRARTQGHHQLNRVNTDKMRMQKCRSGRSTTRPAPCTAEETKEFAEMNLTDHAGVRLTHGKPKVNGVEIHYAIGGAGEPVFLLHGVPKTMSYWRHVVPLLTPHDSVIAVDNRGAGGSQRPPAGYDTATMAGDVAELATHLGFGQFRVAGEDWGAAIAYAVAAFHRPGCGNWCSRKRSCQDCQPARDCQAVNTTPRSPPTTCAPAGTSASSACRTCPSCCWPGGNGRSGRGTPDARCGTPARWPRRTSTK